MVRVHVNNPCLFILYAKQLVQHCLATGVPQIIYIYGKTIRLLKALVIDSFLSDIYQSYTSPKNYKKKSIIQFVLKRFA